jgi:hypothetical protein
LRLQYEPRMWSCEPLKLLVYVIEFPKKWVVVVAGSLTNDIGYREIIQIA